MTDAQRLYRTLALVLGMLDHATSKAVSAGWQARYPDQYRHAVSLIRRSRVLLKEMEHHRLPCRPHSPTDQGAYDNAQE